MRKLNLIGLLVLVFSLGACKKLSNTINDKVKTLTEFNEDIHYVEEMGIPDLPYIPGMDTIPGGGLYASFPPMPLETNSQTIMQEYNTSPDLISNVSVKELGADYLHPENGSFDILDSVELYLSARGLPEVMVAYQYVLEPGTKRLDMEIIDRNIKEYFLEDTMWIRFAGHFVKFPDTGTQINVNAIFNIIGNPLN